MKKLNLLLATTAILSTAFAINVKAGPEIASGNIEARVGFVNSLTVIQERMMDFGSIRNRQSGDKVILGVSSDVPAEGSTERLVEGTTQRGRIFISGLTDYDYDRTGDSDEDPLIRIVLPEEIRLGADSTRVCGYVTDLKASGASEGTGLITDVQNVIHIGGTFEVKTKQDETLSLAGECTGSGTVSFVLYYQ